LIIDGKSDVNDSLKVFDEVLLENLNGAVMHEVKA